MDAARLMWLRLGAVTRPAMESRAIARRVMSYCQKKNKMPVFPEFFGIVVRIYRMSRSSGAVFLSGLVSSRISFHLPLRRIAHGEAVTDGAYLFSVAGASLASP